MDIVRDIKRALGLQKLPSPEAKRVIKRIDVLMQRFEPWTLNLEESKELNRLLAQQANNEWYFKAKDVYAPGPVPSHLYQKSAAGGGARVQRAAEAKKTIVLAWTEEDFRVVRERRADMGERPELEAFRVGKAATWLLRGTTADVAKAEAYAAAERDKKIHVFTFPTSCKDPLGAAKAKVLTLEHGGGARARSGGGADASQRIVRCFIHVRAMLPRNHKRGDPFPQVAELWSRGTSSLMYRSKPCDTPEQAMELCLKYVARNPSIVLT